MPLAMQGLKVLDFSQGVAGPHAALLCAQHGADVVKVEPLAGDWCRALGQQYGDLTANSVVYNRGKRSVAVNMKDAGALAAIRQMALKADVIIESFRPGVMAHFGLDHAAIEKENSAVVYVSINGFGNRGPLVEAPATDMVLQGFTGLMYCNADAGGAPQRIDLVLVDIATGLYAFHALSAGLLERARFGTSGRYIECSLMKSAIALQAGRIVEDFMGGSMTNIYHPAGVFAASDGYLSLTVRRDEHFAALCTGIGRTDLVESGRFATVALRREHAREMLPIVRAALLGMTVAQISAMLTAADILHSRINNHAEMLAHEQTAAAGAIHWRRQDGVEARLPIADIPGAPDPAPDLQAPHLGQHTRQAMQDWGVSAPLIDRLAGGGN